MNKRYYIELSREDRALVSYFPGLEIKNDPDRDWIDDVLAPAVEPLAKRKAAKIKGIPITFWVNVRRTARCSAEIFLFMTPAYPGPLIEDALSKALQPIKGGNIHAGREPIPEDAYPCLQIFRGKLIRLYCSNDGEGSLLLPSLRWEDGLPCLKLISVPPNDKILKVDVPLDEADKFLAEARIISVMNGEHYRKFQQALIPIAREA